MTTEDMKAALEANGYKITQHGAGAVWHWVAISPQKWVFNASHFNTSVEGWEELSRTSEQEAITKAHAHLQQQQELANLRLMRVLVRDLLIRNVDAPLRGQPELERLFKLTQHESADDE